MLTGLNIGDTAARTAGSDPPTVRRLGSDMKMVQFCLLRVA